MSNTTDIDTLNKLGFNFFKEEESENSKFIMIPKQFYICPFYKKYLTPSTRELYAWLVDRMSLSKKTTMEGNHSYVDEKGYIYLIFTRKEVMEKLNLSKQTTSDAFKILSKIGLIYEKRLGQGKTNRIYIGKVRYLNEDEAEKIIKIIENEGLFQRSKNQTSKKCSQKSKNQTSKNSTSKSLKNGPLEVEKIDSNNTTTNNTDNTNTDNLVVDNDLLVNEFQENICNLKKTTKEGFMYYVKNYNKDFIISLINYCAEINIRSFAGFKKAIDSYISKNITTKEKLLKDIENYRKNKIHNKPNKADKIDRFNDFPQRKYDFKSLEKKLLGWSE
ncbi:hypothetical protein FDC64_19250 [Clostridium botulinum]|uniref:replication initiator protein A n=4 Tax=Clostridium botulinum TaxID=1491 RepID=UPI000774746C|nr:replication initiator protein A [Clostridium botulinum]MBY6773702.1 replication initiator protein A [Clostridium botulinum]MBY6864256.1 replication initiator protein A [Clostridium botulinum]MBY6984800.1 replication initiator protein A [Clostridium botulinum]NFP27646.1 hypothetical protein [Clostridium botulinum]